MQSTRITPHARFRILAAAILVIGLGCAVAIYWNAGPDTGSDYELDETKQYLRSLELYGGSANVLATELRNWLGSLWHGTRLAFTVAFMTVVAAFVCWLLSLDLPAPASEDDHVDDR